LWPYTMSTAVQCCDFPWQIDILLHWQVDVKDSVIYSMIYEVPFEISQRLAFANFAIVQLIVNNTHHSWLFMLSFL